MPKGGSGGSTDMGDVSHVVPAIHPWIGLNCPAFTLHSKSFAAATNRAAGDKAIEVGGKALALTAIEVLTNPQLLEDIKAEFAEAQKEW